MNEDLAAALGAIALFSFLAVRSWANAQRREREAYYKSEAIKKLAEMQGTPSEPVLALLREALKPPPELPAGMSMMGPSQVKAFYKSETLKRIAELKGSEADAVLAVMREDEIQTARRVREGLKLGGLITAGVGVGLMLFLQALIPDMPVYLAGLIPLIVGGVLLAYAFLFATGDEV
ncbi:MAG TPA: hypothetical protein VH639_03865 [Bryobacteraceae bacterium]|jgi:hypothetical protein